MKRILQLDGLRALAFLAVFLNHSVYLPMGWVGVDLFFVLSGFLITSILLSRKETSHQGYFKDFYLRRVVRIFPPYFICLALALALFPHAIDWDVFGWQFILFVQNFGAAMGHSMGPLAPLWSLAVEEQFYLIWPFLCYSLKVGSFRRLCVFLLLFTPILRGLFTPYLGSYLYVFCLTPFRFDVLAVGSLIAVYWREQNQSFARWQKAAWSVALVSGAVLFIPAILFEVWRAKANSMSFNIVGYSMSAVFFGAVLVLVLNSNFNSFLTNRYLRRIGTISYTSYLLHEIVLHYTINFMGIWPGSIVGLILVLAVAEVSWRIVEEPILMAWRKNPS